MKRWYLAAAGVILLIGGIALWWDHGLQGWLAVKTGVDYCVNTPAKYLEDCRGYNFHSAFGSIIIPPLMTLMGIGFLWWFHHTCHEPRCVRIARVTIDDHGTRSCWHHHPDGKPRPGHIQRMHDRHVAKMAALLHRESPGAEQQGGTQ